MGHSGLIVGIDIGTTTAVALLDLQGNFLGLKCKKHFSHSEIFEFIQQKGQPVLVATDVSKVPDNVHKISAAFNAIIAAPAKDLGRFEKSALVSSFLEGTKIAADDFHEVSALAAAITCYNKHENKFRQIEKLLDVAGIFGRADEVKKKVLQGISVNRILEGRK